MVLDCANGAAYRAAPDVLWELGADVIPLGVEPDGSTSTTASEARIPRPAPMRSVPMARIWESVWTAMPTGW